MRRRDIITLPRQRGSRAAAVGAGAAGRRV